VGGGVLRFTYFYYKQCVSLIDEFSQAITSIEGSTQKEPKDGEEDNGSDAYEINPTGINEVRKEEKYQQSNDPSDKGTCNLM
jgi:hypothetical protein